MGNSRVNLKQSHISLESAIKTKTPPPHLKLEEVSIYATDCIRGLHKFIQDRSVSVVVTSPPYNIGTKYRTYADNRPRKDYIDWIGLLGKEVNRILEDDGSFFLNVGSRPSDPALPWEIATKLQDSLKIQNVIHWVKAISIDKNDLSQTTNDQEDLSFGHFKPIRSHRFLNDCQEYIFHFTKSGREPLDRLAVGVPYKDKSNIKRWKSTQSDLRCRGNTWYIPYKTIQSRSRQRPHPSSFPEKLPEMCIKLHGQERTNIVLDPFMGIGTTAIAATKMQIPCIGFEIDKGYLETAGIKINDWLISKE